MLYFIVFCFQGHSSDQSESLDAPILNQLNGMIIVSTNILFLFIFQFNTIHNNTKEFKGCYVKGFS